MLMGTETFHALAFVFIPYLLTSIISEVPLAQGLHREKRFILFPYGGTFKLVIGIGIPVKLGSKQSMAVGWNFQFQYSEAQNTTYVETYPPIVSRSRDKRDENYPVSDRAMAYLGVESIMDSHGLNGRACLLRAICDNALDSVHHEANGLYGHLIHIFLTPSYGEGSIEPDLDPVYMDAQKAGEFGVDCISLYPECEYGYGVLDMISILD